MTNKNIKFQQQKLSSKQHQQIDSTKKLPKIRLSWYSNEVSDSLPL
jgi:hypothetical protein